MFPDGDYLFIYLLHSKFKNRAYLWMLFLSAGAFAAPHSQLPISHTSSRAGSRTYWSELTLLEWTRWAEGTVSLLCRDASMPALHLVQTPTRATGRAMLISFQSRELERSISTPPSPSCCFHLPPPLTPVPFFTFFLSIPESAEISFQLITSQSLLPYPLFSPPVTCQSTSSPVSIYRLLVLAPALSPPVYTGYIVI